MSGSALQLTVDAAAMTVAVPAAFAAFGLLLGGRSRGFARDFAVLGSLVTLVAAGVETWGVASDGPAAGIRFLGGVDLGSTTIQLTLRADGLSAAVALAAGLVAFCVQVYSTGYLSGPGTAQAPTRYPAYAATVSLFTAAMMLVVHADDLVLLLVGWEGMGLCSYLLVGHHSERPAARAAAVKAFLVTRVGDLGVLLAVVLLLAHARTTSIPVLLARAGQLPHSTVVTACLLLLAGVAGKSAQFPLHTWLPDAMEGPTPVSALIHAATMVAAGVYLMARLLPLFLVGRAALDVAAVIASIGMLGAALAALAQDDLKRLLAWSTISQVAYMLAGVAVARADGDAAASLFHLLTHAAFKALLFLVAGCVIHLTGSTSMAQMGGLRRTHPRLTLLFALGLAALAGVPPLGGFWSKEAVLTAAQDAASAGVGWPARMVLASGLLTTLVTGVYTGRAYALVAMGEPASTPGPAAAPGSPSPPAPVTLPRSMTWPLWLLAVPTVGLGLILVRPPGVLAAVHVDVFTAFTGSLLSLAGIGWALSVPRLGGRDVADAMPVAVRSFLREGYRLDGVQDALVVRPVLALAGAVAGRDRDVVDAAVRGGVAGTRWTGRLLRRTESGLVSGYLAWLVIGAVLAGIAGVVLT